MSGLGWLSDEDETDLRQNRSGDATRRGKSPSSRAAMDRTLATMSQRGRLRSAFNRGAAPPAPVTLRRFSWEEPA